MHKELNPELFGEKRVVAESASHLTSHIRDRSLEPDFLDVDRQILELRNHVINQSEQTQRLQAQWTEFTKSSHLKIERLHQLISRLESSHNGLVQEIANKLSSMQQRLVERASYDEKTQEMIDRHNQIIQSFEARMSQMQKVLKEKEVILNSTLGALNEAKSEIARLKRI